MDRREFLGASAATLLLAGCGGEEPPPDALHVSATEVYAEDLNSVLYRINRPAHFVSRVSASGAVLWTTGSRGSGPAQFNFPTAIAADNRGRVLVVDRGNARVVILDGASGRYLGTFGSAGRGPGQFLLPRHIAVSPDRIYVVDQLNRRVSAFDMDGNTLFAIGGERGTSGSLDVPRGVAVDSAGNVYVSDATTRGVNKYTATGSYAGRADGGNVSHPHGMGFDSKGDLWVADGITGRVVVLTPQATMRQSIAIRLPGGRAGAPSDVALSGRDIYVRATVNGA